MKGTIVDFLNLAAENDALAREFVDLAARYGFEFSDELNEEELADVAGGVELNPTPQEVTQPFLPQASSPEDLLNAASAMQAKMNQTLMNIVKNLR